jgi:hypothetical protein
VFGQGRLPGKLPCLGTESSFCGIAPAAAVTCRWLGAVPAHSDTPSPTLACAQVLCQHSWSLSCVQLA